MVQKFRMPKYVNIWQSNEKGNKVELLMEAQMGGRRRVGGNLLVRTLAPDWKQIDLGVLHYARYETIPVLCGSRSHHPGYILPQG